MCFDGEISSPEIKPDAVRTKWHQACQELNEILKFTWNETAIAMKKLGGRWGKGQQLYLESQYIEKMVDELPKEPSYWGLDATFILYNKDFF